MAVINNDHIDHLMINKLDIHIQNIAKGEKDEKRILMTILH